MILRVFISLCLLWLTAVARTGSDGLVHGLAIASDLTDVLLFATIAVWAGRYGTTSTR